MLSISGSVAERAGAHRDFQATSFRKFPKPGFSGVPQERKKRLFDLFAALFLLIFLFPVMVIIALAIRLTSSGPALFQQTRYGLHKREFEILKFRTMTVMEDGANFTPAKHGDERITALGRFLRRTSLDELPQLWNVIRGDMSLVGPRPHATAMDDYFGKRLRRYDRRFMVRPGITGLAQCTGFRGNAEEMSKMIGRVGRDVFYVRHRSMALDMKILMMTVITLLSDDAY